MPAFTVHTGWSLESSEVKRFVSLGGLTVSLAISGEGAMAGLLGTLGMPVSKAVGVGVTLGVATALSVHPEHFPDITGVANLIMPWSSLTSCSCSSEPRGPNDNHFLSVPAGVPFPCWGRRWFCLCPLWPRGCQKTLFTVSAYG